MDFTLSFNTSHVSINRKRFRGSLWVEKSFNTSHVSINQQEQGDTNLLLLVSIHLMFLLIGREEDYTAMSLLFQYISCFY